jgi:hypothetical protein
MQKQKQKQQIHVQSSKNAKEITTQKERKEGQKTWYKTWHKTWHKIWGKKHSI